MYNILIGDNVKEQILSRLIMQKTEGYIQRIKEMSAHVEIHPAIIEIGERLKEFIPDEIPMTYKFHINSYITSYQKQLIQNQINNKEAEEKAEAEAAAKKAAAEQKAAETAAAQKAAMEQKLQAQAGTIGGRPVPGQAAQANAQAAAQPAQPAAPASN